MRSPPLVRAPPGADDHETGPALHASGGRWGASHANSPWTRRDVLFPLPGLGSSCDGLLAKALVRRVFGRYGLMALGYVLSGSWSLTGHSSKCVQVRSAKARCAEDELLAGRWTRWSLAGQRLGARRARPLGIPRLRCVHAGDSRIWDSAAREESVRVEVVASSRRRGRFRSLEVLRHWQRSGYERLKALQRVVRERVAAGLRIDSGKLQRTQLRVYHRAIWLQQRLLQLTLSVLERIRWLYRLRERRAARSTSADWDMVLESGWARRGFGSPASRAIEIWSFALRQVWMELRLRRIRDPAQRAEGRRHGAQSLKEGLLRLGPTFIKLGQLASTRVDLFPREYIEELSTLQDQVPPFPMRVVRQIIKDDLGRDIEELFDEFEEEPMAAASLGQVHKARINGQDVAVKVQRAGLRELFDVDLKNLRVLAQMLDWLDPKTDGASRNWLEIYNESARLLYEEIDYEHEAQNAKKFADNFVQNAHNGGSMDDWVRVPRILDAYTTKRVLVMEYVKGTKISKLEAIDALGLDRILLAERLGRFFLEQTLRHGFIHCDPHPGNIAVDDQGRLLVYDFGMCQRLTSSVRRAVVNLVFATYENDVAAFVEALSEMGVLKETADRLTVSRIARYFLKAFRERLDGNIPPIAAASTANGPMDRSTPTDASAAARMLPDAEQRLARQASLEKRLAAIGEELLAVADDQPFQFPVVFTFVFRALTSIDGAAKALNPSFDITRLTRPYLRDLIDLRDGSIAKTALKTATKALGWRREDLASVVTQPRKVAYIESVLRKIETGDLKIRVRTLEIERSFKLLSIMVEMLGHGILASVLINMAIAGIFVTLSYVGAAFCGIRVLVGYINLRLIQQRQAKYARGGN
jgi:predicted unusual protein kinase regulating ubiquinone biosynthesis (AarF/ABC1/UbiB family)